MTFAASSFQNIGFQVDRGGGGSAQRRFVVGYQMRQKPARIKYEPTPEDVAALLTEARTRFRITTRPYATTDLGPIIDRMRAARDEAELKEMMRMLANIDDWIVDG